MESLQMYLDLTFNTIYFKYALLFSLLLTWNSKRDCYLSALDHKQIKKEFIYLRNIIVIQSIYQSLNITITLYAGCSLTRLIVKWLFNLNPQVNIKDRKFVAGIVALTCHCSLIPYTNHPFYIWICNINVA